MIQSLINSVVEEVAQLRPRQLLMQLVQLGGCRGVQVRGWSGRVAIPRAGHLFCGLLVLLVRLEGGPSQPRVQLAAAGSGAQEAGGAPVAGAVAPRHAVVSHARKGNSLQKGGGRLKRTQWASHRVAAHPWAACELVAVVRLACAAVNRPVGPCRPHHHLGPDDLEVAHRHFRQRESGEDSRHAGAGGGGAAAACPRLRTCRARAPAHHCALSVPLVQPQAACALPTLASAGPPPRPALRLAARPCRWWWC